MRILLIEPDTVLTRIYADALRKQGYEVYEARSASEAIGQADIEAPDLVILELQLGTHNGIEFLQEFRSHQDWLSIPVIVHTLQPERLLKKYTTNWRSLGVARVLPKTSTTLDGFLKAISEVVTNER